MSLPILTVREKPAGGDVRPQVEERPGTHVRGRRRLVLLIHGYNNTESAALQSYQEFLGNVASLGPGVRGILDDLVGFLWPGDAGLGPLSFASYPTEIRPAKEAADRLAAFLQDLRGPGATPMEVVLIAHSLGSRVALELLQTLALARPATRIERSCLMAAAVPVPMLRAGGRLVDGASLSRTLVLHSSSDPVLRWGFPLGETLAREGWFPEAVGRAGKPLYRWSTNQRMFRDGRKGYGHGDYWKGRETLSPLLSFLGVAMPSEPPVSLIPDHELPEPLELVTNEWASAELPVRPAFG